MADIRLAKFGGEFSSPYFFRRLRQLRGLAGPHFSIRRGDLMWPLPNYFDQLLADCVYECLHIAVKTVVYVNWVKQAPVVCYRGYDTGSREHVMLPYLYSCLHSCCSALLHLCPSVNRTLCHQITSSIACILSLDTLVVSHPSDETTQLLQ